MSDSMSSGALAELDRPVEDTSDPTEFAASSSDTSLSRLTISALSLASLAVGSIATVAGVDTLRAVALVAFCLWGIGSAPFALNGSLRLPARLTWTAVISLSTLTFGAMVMSQVGSWQPYIAFLVVCLVCVPLHSMGLVRAWQDRGRDASDALFRNPFSTTFQDVNDLRRLIIAVAAGVAGAALCLISALLHRNIDIGIGGFLTQIGVVWYVGLALLLIAIVLSVTGDERVLAVLVVLLMLALTLTPALVYGLPKSQSAEKHVDLVQQIRMFGHTDSSISVYNSWPGFFAAMAWLCDIAGIKDPIHLATYWPAILGIFRVTALRYMFGQVLRSPARSWAAVVLAVLVDTVGQDYFSPQSVGYVIGLACFGLALSKNDSWLRRLMLLDAGILLAVSHQLSPFIVSGVLVVLVIFRQIRPWWLPALTLGPAVAWTLLHLGGLGKFFNLSDIGLLTNFRPPVTAGTAGLARLPIVGQTSYALALGILILLVGALITLWRTRQHLQSWAYLVCPGVGLALVVVNPYGNEGIFRAALFGIPWLALLAAQVFFRDSTLARSSLPSTHFHRGVFGVTAFVLAFTFLISADGLDASGVIRPGDLAAVRYFQNIGGYDSNGKHVLLQIGPGDLPVSPALSSNGHTPLTRDQIYFPVQQQSDADMTAVVQKITESLIATSDVSIGKDADLYALWSPVSSYYGWEYGIQTPEQFAQLRDAFEQSSYWTTVLQDDGTVLFRFKPENFPPSN